MSRGQWRSLRQLERDPAFLARAAREFPGLADPLASPVDRRRVLALMGAAFAMAGLGGCGEPDGVLIPAVRQPPGLVPSIPDYYASAAVLDGYADGIVVKHWMGRPIKVEGNPAHPASLGATSAIGQALVLDFYDPHRRAALARNGEPADRAQLLTALAAERARLAATGGAGLRILSGTITSPTLGRRLDALRARYPEARWHRWDAISRESIRQGARLAYDADLAIVPHLDRADIVLAIDGDLLDGAPGHLRFARDLAGRRNPVRAAMSRIYAVEPTPTAIGVLADHRIVAGPREIAATLRALAASFLGGGAAEAPPLVAAAIEDLKVAHGRGFVHVGRDQPAEAHALVHAVNEALGGRARTFDLVDAPEHAPPSGDESLAALVEDMRAGRVTTLVMLDTNPVYAAPGALGFAEALPRVPFSLALAPAPDETTDAATWFVPMAHLWESWSDARAFDGTATILQPQSLPLYDGMSPLALLGLLNEAATGSAEGEVRATWPALDAAAWRDALAEGVVAGTARPPSNAALRRDAVAALPAAAAAGDGPHILFRPDPHLWDGRFAGNPWLLEVPRAMTKLTWDNPLLIAPALGRSLGVGNGERVRIEIGGAAIVAPVWLLPGQAADCITAPLGFGRSAVGLAGQGAGYAYAPLIGRPGPVGIAKAEGRVALASTEHHDLLVADANEFVRHAALAAFEAAPPRPPHDDAADPQLYRLRPPGPAAWAMSIDLNACIGCNACVVACQAENNIPVVGRDEVMRQREMHWLRIDRYYEGDPDSPDTYLQPMLCMHCEQAPCEIVCPVGATVHDAEGLNVMVYNRCVGTRFCSNNCPYKVRRFNYRAYAQEQPRPAESWNPDVTVRARGVMEKCTFCVQRIAGARIAADRGEPTKAPVQTACQAACPTNVFTFGDLADPASEIARRKASPLDYALLSDQNTHPRVTYEARILNRSPASEAAQVRTPP